MSLTSDSMPDTAQRPWILQLCHGYDAPFLDCARQYAALFSQTDYSVCTVYLTGAPDEAARTGSASDEVVFLGFDSRAIRNLKLAAIRELRKLAKERDFCLCIAHRFKPVYTALLATTLPVIAVHHAFGDYRRFSRKFFARFFRKRLSFLGVSNAVRDDLRASLAFLPQEQIQTLYNRLDVESVRRGLHSRKEARAALGLPPEAWIVGNVGRLHPDKDQVTLLKAFSLARPKLPAGSLLAIMGEGRLKEELKQLAENLSIVESVRFLGQVAEGRRYFCAFDLFALASDREPFGMVLLEAMAAEVPAICTNSGGGREVVADADDLFPFSVPSALAEKIICRAHETANEHILRVQQGLKCLITRFSDPVIREAFWKLPFDALSHPRTHSLSPEET